MCVCQEVLGEDVADTWEGSGILFFGEESEDENEMGPEEEPLGAMRSEGATDLGD